MRSCRLEGILNLHLLVQDIKNSKLFLSMAVIFRFKIIYCHRGLPRCNCNITNNSKYLELYLPLYIKMRQGQRGQDLIYLTFCYLLDNHQAVRTRSALIARSLSINVTFYIYIE